MRQDWHDERIETSSLFDVEYPRRPGGVRTTGVQLNRNDDAEPALPSHTFHETHPLAPEQIAVVSDAPGLTDAVARESLQVLDLLHATASGTVLLLEPFVGTLGQLLREGGFQGQCWALTSPVSQNRLLAHLAQRTDLVESADFADQVDFAELADPAYPPLPPQREAHRRAMKEHITSANGHTAAFDRTVVTDWIAAMRERRLPEMPLDQRFHVVVVLQLSRMLSPSDWHTMLGWLTGLLVPEGFLIVGEPASWIHQRALESDLFSAGLLLSADTRRIETDWSWLTLRWQYRPGDFGRLPSALARVSRADLEANTALRHAMVASFREVFGGDEWGEWKRCSRCGRQYSRREYDELDPPDWCVCGAEQSLAVIHTPQHVLAELARDLTDGERSRLYVCIGQTQEVEAFIWGYLTTARRIAEILLPRQGHAERQRLTQLLLGQLTQLGVPDPESALIYHQAYIGSVKQARSFSLPRALFARMCQFAHDQGVQLVVTATIPSVNAYTLLRGIGMDVVYTYPTPGASEHPHGLQNGESGDTGNPAVPAHTDAQTVEMATAYWTGHDTLDEEIIMPYSRLDESGVILAGSVHEILSLLVSKSERTVAKTIGVFLRQQRMGASENGMRVGDDRST